MSDSAGELELPTRAWGGYGRAVGFGFVLLAFIALCVARAPQIFTRGRVYGEDGAYLRVAQELSFWRMLGHVEPAVGYRLLPLNLAGYVGAHWVPLEYAGVCYSACGVLVLMLPVLLLVMELGGDKTARPFGARLKGGVGDLARLSDREQVALVALLAAAVLFVAPQPEVWLNMTCAQFPLALSAGMILALPANGGGRRQWVRCGVLGVCGLSGMPSVLLAPVFAARALWEGSWGRWVQAGIIGACLASQVYTMKQYAGQRQKQQFTREQQLATLVVKQFAAPLVGFEYAETPKGPPGASRVGLLTEAVTGGGTIRSGGRVLLYAAPACIYVGALALAVRARSGGAFFLVLAAGASAAAGLAGALHGPVQMVSTYVGGRYFFAPNVMLAWAVALALVDGAAAGRIGRAGRVACVGILLWALAVGAREFVRPQSVYFDGPSWFEEIAKWRQDPGYQPMFAPGWRVQLKRG